jgi:hypothetical protein
MSGELVDLGINVAVESRGGSWLLCVDYISSNNNSYKHTHNSGSSMYYKLVSNNVVLLLLLLLLLLLRDSWFAHQ